MKLFRDVLKKNRTAIVLFVVMCATNFSVFMLYRIIIEPLIYSSILSLFFLTVFIVCDYTAEHRRATERKNALYSVSEDRTALPKAYNESERDYQRMIAVLGEKINSMNAEFNAERQESMDYYTAWVHQIKTPIAVLKLMLSDDKPEYRAMSAELLRIEQYSDMVLQYIRLGSGTNDLVIREYPLDDMIRETVRRFAPLFIEKKLKLDYTPTDKSVVTDRKWLCCILEQLISNAIKYTPSGTVSIYVKDDILTVSDTGIGIAQEDLPRIFESGYTGNNGRLGQKSSGLGLHLVRKASEMLAIKVTVTGSVGEGSSFSLDLSRKTRSQS